MTEPMFLALTALLDEPRHGYGIVQEVDRLSEGAVQLKIGSLYGVLDRLAADGLVELDHEEAHSGRLRRYYRITDAGEDALATELARLNGTLQIAAQRLGARRRSATSRPLMAGGSS
ncbi:PadR family transcriptional regulator [Nonomuraea phyllanthi]|uniref:PadR family transcriptional regulator n=2 Tax=Nonomuraea phyllanthi TaxID=2219224 RepID=A0A5C4VXX7_9ACTN|nr:PadR family transcriptional regulator [Nonomuraea phyllanthi]QFY13954.1 PadR family transcriptional regulator [Nonomuraea phyllanthi]